MDQGSSADEPRDRVLSAELSTTRPNPFDDDHDSSARKRRRTSLSHSRSASVETPLSQEYMTTVDDTNDMKIDTPEPLPPNTPARSTGPAEPVSSRVTINLRNTEHSTATPNSPTSPTPAREGGDHIHPSVEGSELETVPEVHDVPSSPSVMDSVEEVGRDAVNPYETRNFVVHSSAASHERKPVKDLRANLVGFPYRQEGETLHDTLVRIAKHFRQQPNNVDEGIEAVHRWLGRCLSSARHEHLDTVVEVFRENRAFWNALPEVFYQISQRLSITKHRETRAIIHRSLTQFAKLTALLMGADMQTLSQKTIKETADLDLMSSNYLRVLGLFPIRNDQHLMNGHESDQQQASPEPLEACQTSPDGSMATLLSFIEHHISALAQFPRKVMENLSAMCSFALGIARESAMKLGAPTSFPPDIIDRSRSNLDLAHKCFVLVSNALDTVVEKSVNTLTPDIISHLGYQLNDIIRMSLQGDSADATNLVRKYRQEHPYLDHQYTHEAIAMEWRFQLFCQLIKSRQMQLRVCAASIMCDDLVAKWKKYSDRAYESVEDNEAHMEFLRHISRFVTGTGIVDYILGPTCHPEIITSSSNIVGFLAVTKTYTPAQTDLMWQTLVSAQDPRIPEALVRMMMNVTGLLQTAEQAYFLEKFQHLPIESFTPAMRELFDNISGLLQSSTQAPSRAVYDFCVRLVRESSAFTAQGSIVHPDISHFALAKLRRLLQAGFDEEGRKSIVLTCLADIASRSKTTSGSLLVLQLIIANPSALQSLIEEHNFTGLLIDDFESVLQLAKDTGVSSIYSHNICAARRRFLTNIINQFPATIDLAQGQRLWDSLVGDKSVGHEDRKAGWDDLISALRRPDAAGNEFLANCLHVFLPQLLPQFYCIGSLAFVREVVVPAVNDDTSIVLDDDVSKPPELELLWQMILRAPDSTIEEQAIHILVNDIYVDSKLIVSYPLQRARKIHFSLAQRCLSQLKSAAQDLKALMNGALGSGDSESMVISVTDDQSRALEFQFTRSLKVLTTLLKILQTKSHFTAPDLRSLMLPTPDAINGEPAELKYQSFDEDTQTDVKTLSVGLKNTAASLLASIRAATGFDNYRLYYRGSTFIPSQIDICKSLEELNIRSGLILVKKEQDLATSPVLIKPGASLLEIDILTHFEDLWEYLSMEEKLAQEIYRFLTSLPADDSILTAFEEPVPSHRAVFPLGQPFKSLYAIYALREYLSNRKLRNHMMHRSNSVIEAQKQSSSDRHDATAKALTLITSAICDHSVIEQCSSENVKLHLSLQLVDTLFQLLKETTDTAILNQLLTSTLYQRLISILGIGADARFSPVGLDLAHRCFDTLLECCTKSNSFWVAFRAQPVIEQVIFRLLLADERTILRKHIAKLISNRCSYTNGRSALRAIDFAEFFWPIVYRLFPQAILQPFQCEELFSLSSHLLRKLLDNDSSTFDLLSCARESEELLMSHTSIEDIVQTGLVDQVAYGLVGILHLCVKPLSAGMNQDGSVAVFPIKRLFTRHLFPPEDEGGPLVPPVILHQPSRGMLYEVIFNLCQDKREQTVILQNLNALTAFRREEGTESYKYDLPQAFDRAAAIRSPCGYSGLRNLSNTCYLNSLFTQLFMNIEFRRFILNAKADSESHLLLYETQSLFANLQDSRRRFIDPAPCVEQIIYRDQPIDIHVQMDVDEFYILLFDRWEAQLSTEAEKRTLRSIYGGQLVHQIKSQECEHISERVEPFSAIQCDIKGKASLEESLQAYVDGEMMDGDNKYKCSACDRHVDAVKRACLKDLPDNLIFHLKRFDFNLRLLQRSKINDHFAFPSTVDMRPYTVDYLNESSPDQSPDVFELVGVLVHSGTAETGHYYSYIRERPTSFEPPSWVEFNDETVTAWDPKLMESSCFGGTDPRLYDNNGSVFEKSYSAYMLFYQRSSSLRREQESFNAVRDERQVRTRIPPELELQVKQDNWSMVQRHSLYDRTHVSFVTKTLERFWSKKCSEDHREENLAMQVAIGHLDQVVSRSKDLVEFDRFSSLIIKACQKCSLCSFAFLQYFQHHKDVFRAMLARNVDPTVRHDIGQTFLYALRKFKANHPEEYGILDSDDDAAFADASSPTILEGAADLFLHLIETFQTRLGAWPELFGTMADFAQFGRLESAALLDRDILRKTLLIVMADSTFDLPPQYTRLVQILGRRMPNRPPSYEAIITLIDVLLGHMDSQIRHGVREASGRLSMALQDDIIPFTSDEFNLLHRNWDGTNTNVFLDKLLQLNQNTAGCDNIIGKLVASGDTLDLRVLHTLQGMITGQVSHLPMGPFLRAGLIYCGSSYSANRVAKLIEHVSSQCRALDSNEARSFFEFQRDVYAFPRMTGEKPIDIHVQSIDMIPIWAPGLLGSADRAASNATEHLLDEKLFSHGASPTFAEAQGGVVLSQAIVRSSRALGVACLLYLRRTYILPNVQAPRDFVAPVLHTCNRCAVYFEQHRDETDGEAEGWDEHRESVLDTMSTLMVETLDDEPSDWEGSIGSSVESLAELSSMPVDHDVME